MIKRTLLIAMTLFALAAVAQDKEDKKDKPDAWSGVAMGTGGSVGGQSLQFDFRITDYTSDEDVDQLAQLVKDKNKGTDALRRELEKRDVGRINRVGTVGNQIAVARRRKVGSNTVIIIVTARQMPFLELYNNGRSTDYPFGFMQITLPDDGKPGTGQIMAAAKLKFNHKKGHYEIESYGNGYVKAINVRPWK
jgi:hypothetical protein